MSKKILFFIFVVFIGIPIATYGDYYIYKDISILNSLFYNIVEGIIFLLGLCVGYWISETENKPIKKSKIKKKFWSVTSWLN